MDPLTVLLWMLCVLVGVVIFVYVVPLVIFIVAILIMLLINTVEGIRDSFR